MLDADTAEKLLLLLEKSLGFYRDFLDLEKKKYEDLLSGRLEKLDGRLKREQAFVLESRGLDRKRQKLMDQTGNPRASFRELLPDFPPEKREKAESLYRGLSEVLFELKRANARCQKMAKVRLNQVSRVLSKLGDSPELRRPYRESAKTDVRHSGLFSMKV